MRRRESGSSGRPARLRALAHHHMDSTPRRSLEEARERDRAIQGEDEAKAAAQVDDTPLDGYQPGDSVLDFTIEAIIGTGEFGEVYKARPTDGGAVLALKAVKLSKVQADDFRLIAVDPQVRFAIESAICSAIGLHPNIVSMRRVLSTPKGLMIAMDLVEGKHLRELTGVNYNEQLYQGGRAKANERVDALVAQIYKGLAHLHARCVLHQDIKPEVRARLSRRADLGGRSGA